MAFLSVKVVVSKVNPKISANQRFLSTAEWLSNTVKRIQVVQMVKMASRPYKGTVREEVYGS